MKIKEDFIDLVYEVNSHEEYKSKIRRALVRMLPDMRICDLTNILIIDMRGTLFAVKIRMCYLKDDGSPDIEKIHNKITDSDFTEISINEYYIEDRHKSDVDAKEWVRLTRITDRLVKPNSNIIFKI